MKKIVALITACGRGNRFNSSFKNGEGIPKQYLPLAGISLLRHSINAFLNHPKIDDVMCVIHPDDIDLYEEAVSGLDLLNTRSLFCDDKTCKRYENSQWLFRDDDHLSVDGAKKLIPLFREFLSRSQ